MIIMSTYSVVPGDHHPRTDRFKKHFQILKEKEKGMRFVALPEKVSVR